MPTQNTPRAGQSKLELDKVIPVLTTIDSSINASSINDIHHMGKLLALTAIQDPY